MGAEEPVGLTDRVMVEAAQMKVFGRDPLILEEGDGIRVRARQGLLVEIEVRATPSHAGAVPASARFGERVHLAAHANSLLLREAPAIATFAPPLIVTEA